ncbi:MAG TPA: hypothetical protein VLA38_13080, partial [Steroidobacteraceae bacterium]|nr:hypothetical protein [Steroidobacteraceae bacterium]
MATLRFELTGRFLAGIAAASLLAGISMDVAAAGTWGNSGAIRLQLGGRQTNQFLYETPLGVATASQKFKIQPGTKCFLGWESGTPLVS